MTEATEATEPTEIEALRRRFAETWGRMGAAWGVAPSTAAVQGYLLVHGGPLTQAEIRTALGLSHRATHLALAECETWGIVERATERRRSGSRGPAGAAWVPVTDHWEWFRRVAGARKAREADPVIELVEQHLAAAERAAPGDPEMTAVRDRLASLLGMVRRFETPLASLIASDRETVAGLFDVLGRLDPRTLDRLLRAVGTLPAEDLARAATTLAELPPAGLRHLVRAAAQPGVGKLIRALPGTRSD
jgi:DNA-binding transcriptional regulator GbsR (MarR family)